jgi:hypothetical protein
VPQLSAAGVWPATGTRRPVRRQERAGAKERRPRIGAGR